MLASRSGHYNRGSGRLAHIRCDFGKRIHFGRIRHGQTLLSIEIVHGNIYRDDVSLKFDGGYFKLQPAISKFGICSEYCSCWNTSVWRFCCFQQPQAHTTFICQRLCFQYGSPNAVFRLYNLLRNTCCIKSTVSIFAPACKKCTIGGFTI